MAQHRFHGRWNYFEMPDGDVTSEPDEGEDMILDIPDEAGHVNEDRSSHAGFPVDGEATNRRIKLKRKEEGNLRTLNGRVVFDRQCGNVDHIVIVGRFKDEDSELRLQDEGTWVITKP